ncbi:class I SAM-dependent methyltransferase [Aminobacter sp. LjRoot7]|uniref:class I SAM-dependent methyltransferase n=1 Tax=Aminobacter sp. LjRoot7 TaxID=3342335 RepID=UPI003ECC5CA3
MELLEKPCGGSGHFAETLPDTSANQCRNRPMASYQSLLSADPPPAFAYIEPPFEFNSQNVSKYPPEVTGSLVLNSISRRLGWHSLAGMRLLDLGCGVRLARAIVNLQMPIGLYAGVDVNAASIAWLKENVQDARLRFEHLDMHNALYNPAGAHPADDELSRRGLTGFDAACMLSVVTHQDPDDTRKLLRMLHACVRPGGQLYFTAFLDEAIEAYVDKEAGQPRAWTSYNPDFLIGLVAECGWAVKAIYAGSVLHQPALVCDRL